MNVENAEPFIEATRELLGITNAYPMIALGRVQEKTGWKIYAGVNSIPIEIANEVSKSIDEYLTAKKYAGDDSDDIELEDYIPEQYIKEFNNSIHFRSVIENIKPHPCGTLVSPDDLIDNIGLIKIKDKICVAIEGSTAEKLGYLKEDFLTVSVVSIIDKIYEKIGIEQHSTQELVKLCENNQKVWDIYELGYTAEVNQFTAPRTKKMMEIYKPLSITDLSAAVAFIRPGASSIVNEMVKRVPYSFGIEEIDNILFSHTGIGSYCVYQESIMAMLSFAGIDTKETYDIVKAISKKKEDIIKSAKETFINGTIKHAKGDIKKIEKAAKDIWTIIESAAKYSFNAPHALSVSLDSLYIAYLKVVYPKETYTTLLDFYSIGKKRKINKIAEFKRELLRLGKTVHPIKMGYTSDITEYRDDGYIQSLLSVKGANVKLAKFLKTIRPEENPLLVYFKMKDTRDELGKSAGDKRSLTALCKMGYFDGIAYNKKIMEYAPILYDNVYSKKQFRDTSIEKLKTILNIDDIEIDKYISRKTAKTYYLDEAKKADFCLDLFNKIPDIEFSITEKALNQIDTYGYLVDYAMFKEHKIIDGYIKTVSQKEKYIIIVSHTTGSELKCYMKSMVGIKKKINILILGLQIKLKQVHVLNFKTYI